MSESCNHNCGSCGQDCSARDIHEKLNPKSSVKKVIGVVSGKGGVGKSLVTSMLAVAMTKQGKRAAILDADITGPSIPKAFGLKGRVTGEEKEIYPMVSRDGVQVMSINFLLENETDPVVWRGPIIAGAVKQFWSDVVWDNVDYMFVDMPPGTGDVPLTVFQSLPVDGIVIVTSPQDLVSMVVAKAVNMARTMDVPVLGLVENYSYVECGCCGEKMYVFGESHIEDTARKFNLPVLGRLPLNPNIAKAVDAGDIEGLQGDWLDDVALVLKELQPVKATDAEQGNYTLAVTTDENNNIFQHFGHCEKFTLYTFSDGILMSKTVLEPKDSGHEALAGVLAERGVKVLLCGGIGMGAMQALMQADILVVPGLTGDIEVAVAGYLDGVLGTSTEANCHSHDSREGGCGAGGCGCSCGCH